MSQARQTEMLEAGMDSFSGAVNAIGYAHHGVHSGSYFRSGMNFSLANGQVATFGFVTPNSAKWAHLTWFLTTTADGTFDLIEDATSLSGGAACTPLNHNRNSLTASAMTCTNGMTGANLITPTGGTTILSAILATGKEIHVERGVTEEFVLKQNSKYLFRYTNGTSTNVIRLVTEWYEHENR